MMERNNIIHNNLYNKKGKMGGNRKIFTKCFDCNRLLPGTHFKSLVKLTRCSGKVVCIDCQRLCQQCGVRLPKGRFTAEGFTNICDSCVRIREKASGNVYFKYPTLKYVASPLSVEKYRNEMLTSISSAGPSDFK
eukprot:Tbor_TRINITY_DN996_c0_g1::TRINITY_DN996_c0_g1_i1::g.21127::m.21127